MAGHNKWTQIKRKKEASDAVKSRLFSKLNRLISLEAKKAGGDKTAPGLRMAIEKAKSLNMPKEAIERAVQKANSSTEALLRVTYESYADQGVAIIIEGLTGNRNKASAEIKHILNKNGASLGAIGSAIWAFSKKDGIWMPNAKITLPKESKEKLLKLIEELEENDEVQEVFTNADI